MADNIVLQQPLGTDEYNVGVFNANFQIIQDYLNKFNNQLVSSLEVKYPTEININTINNGIYICDFTDESKATGTYPIDILGKQNFIIVSYGLYQETSQVQFFADMTQSKNKTYIRYAKDNSEWSQWTELGDGNETSGGNYVLQYPNTLDLNNINHTSIYVCSQFQGNIPWDNNNYISPESGVYATTNNSCFIFHYGDESNLPIYQRFIVVNIDASGKCIEYTRFKNVSKITADGQITKQDNWTVWEEVSSSGSSDIEVSVVEIN